MKAGRAPRRPPPALATEVALDRIPELLGEIERLRAVAWSGYVAGGAYAVTTKCRTRCGFRAGCFENAESNVVPTPPGGGPSPGPTLGAVLCYQTKCKRPFTPTAEMADQFGARMVVFKGAQFMCAPANRGASRRRARQPRCHPSRAVLPMASAKDSAARAGCARRRRRGARASAGRRPAGRRTRPRATASAPTRARRASSTCRAVAACTCRSAPKASRTDARGSGSAAGLRSARSTASA